MTAITPTEIELLASLRDDPAYMLLLSKIKVLIENLEDKLHTSSDEKETRENFAMWKALRTVYIELKETPESFAQIVSDLHIEERVDREVSPRVTKEFKDFFLKLQGIRAIEDNALSKVQKELQPDKFTFGNVI